MSRSYDGKRNKLTEKLENLPKDASEMIILKARGHFNPTLISPHRDSIQKYNEEEVLSKPKQEKISLESQQEKKVKKPARHLNYQRELPAKEKLVIVRPKRPAFRRVRKPVATSSALISFLVTFSLVILSGVITYSVASKWFYKTPTRTEKLYKLRDTAQNSVTSVAGIVESVRGKLVEPAYIITDRKTPTIKDSKRTGTKTKSNLKQKNSKRASAKKSG